MGNPHLGRGRVVASDSDSSDDDNDYPRPTQQQQRAQEEMAGIAMVSHAEFIDIEEG